MLASLASMALGVVREMLTAAHFGPSAGMDAYFFASSLVVRLPDFLEAAAASALVPLYLQSRQQGAPPRFVGTVITVYAVALLAVALGGLAALPLILATLAAGFDAEGRRLVAGMLAILAPTLVLSAVWGVLRAVLNAQGEFFRSTVSTAFLSVGVIGAVLLLRQPLGAYSLAVGVLAAAVLQVLWAGYWSRKGGYRYRPALDWHDPVFRRFLALSGPALAGGLLGYLLPVIDRSMAARFGPGTIAALGFAEQPMRNLAGLLIYSFGTALIASLAEQARTLDRRELRRRVTGILSFLLFVTVPVSLLAVALRVPVTRVLFERGRFDAAATEATAGYFAATVIGLAPMAIAVTVSAVFYALQDTRTPAIWGAGVNLASKVTLNLVLTAGVGAIGLPVATSLMYAVSATVLLWRLGRRLHGLEVPRLLRTAARVVPAAVLAAAPVHALAARWQDAPLLAVAAGTVVGGAVFLLAAALLRIPELQTARRHLLTMVAPRAAAASG
jgi:putative peptidoglycan lipid II flippase